MNRFLRRTTVRPSTEVERTQRVHDLFTLTDIVTRASAVIKGQWL